MPDIWGGIDVTFRKTAGRLAHTLLKLELLNCRHFILCGYKGAISILLGGGEGEKSYVYCILRKTVLD